MIIESIAEQVCSAVSRFLPENWSKLVFYIEYPQDGYSMEFYVRSESSNYVKCFDVYGIEEEALLDTFDSLESKLSTSRAEALPNEAWTSMTMTLDSAGDFNIDFGYEDVSVEPYKRKKAWKKKYLV